MMSTSLNVAGAVTGLPSRPQADPLLRHFKLKRFRRGDRHLIVLLRDFARLYCEPGLLDETDANIAQELETDVAHLHILLDKMSSLRLARETEIEGRRVYELGTLIEPRYQDDPRPDSNWERPLARVNAQHVPAPPLPVDAEGRPRRRGNQRYDITDLDGYERKEFSEDCRRHEALGLPWPNRDVWIVDFRARKTRSESGTSGGRAVGTPVSPSDKEADISVIGNNQPGDSGQNGGNNQLVIVTPQSPGTAGNNGSRETSLESVVVAHSLQQQDSSNPAINVNVTPANVTSASDLIVTSAPALSFGDHATVAPREEAAASVLSGPNANLSAAEIEAEVAALVACDVGEYTARDLVRQYGAPACARQRAYLPYQESVKDRPAYLRRAIEQNYGRPAGYVAEQRAKRVQQEGAQELAREQGRLADRKQRDALVQEQIDGYYLNLTPGEKAVLLREAAEKLHGMPRGWFRQWEEARAANPGMPPGKTLQGQLDICLDEVIRARLNLPPRRDKCSVAGLVWVAPMETGVDNGDTG